MSNNNDGTFGAFLLGLVVAGITLLSMCIGRCSAEDSIADQCEITHAFLVNKGPMDKPTSYHCELQK